MIEKAIIISIVPIIIISLFLFFGGVRQVQFGNEYYSFLGSLSDDFEQYYLTIPNIPKIDKLSTYSGDYGWTKILTILIYIFNFLIDVVNSFVSILNVVIYCTNLVIHVVQFFILLLRKFSSLISEIVRNNLTPARMII